MSSSTALVANSELAAPQALELIARTMNAAVTDDGRDGQPVVRLPFGALVYTEVDEFAPGYPLVIDIYDLRGESFAEETASGLALMLSATLGWKVESPDSL